MPQRKKPHRKKRPTKPRADSEPKALREWKEKFLEHFARTGNVLRSAQSANIDRGTAYKAYKSDEDFREAWKLAEGDAGDAVDEVAARNMEWENPVTYEGQIVFVWVNAAGQYVPTPANKKQAKLATARGFFPVPLMERKHDAALIALLCRARNPARFRENVKHTHSGPGGGPIPIDRKQTVEVDFNGLAHELEKLARASADRRVRPDGHQKPVDSGDPD